MLVPRWATWEHFWELEGKGLMMFGQMTAGSWIYIGSQGIVQGTFETLAECADRHFDGSLAGRLVLTAGLGGMGGAQPLAVTMNGGVCLAVEVDEARACRRVEGGYCDRHDRVDRRGRGAVPRGAGRGRPLSIGLIGNAAETHAELLRRGVTPDVATDQTSAHDPLNGYVPAGLSLDQAAALRAADPDEYVRRARASMAEQVRSLLAMKARGTVVFDYGNNLRGEAERGGLAARAGVRVSGIRARVHPPARSASARARSAGRRCRAIPATSWPPIAPPSEEFPDDAAPAPLDPARPAARALPGIAGAHLLAGLRRARATGPALQPHGARRGAQGAGGDRARSPRMPARWRRPTARPRACGRAATRWPTGRS